MPGPKLGPVSLLMFRDFLIYQVQYGLPRWFGGKESAASEGDTGSVPGLGRSPGAGSGNPLQYSCLENSMDRQAWQATVHEVAKNQTQLSMQHVCTRFN